MATIVVKPDCGNSPKMAQIRDFSIAFTEQNADFILNQLTDDIRWEMVGDKIIEGKDNATKMIRDMLDDSTEELVFENIMTHGDVGAANGTMTFKDGSRFAFCDVYTFSSHAKDAKIQKLTSFIVAVK